jgi:hypothetical protein
MSEIKATFKSTGGLTRSTTGNDPPDLLEEALHWIWSWRIQVKRLRDSTAEQAQGKTQLEICQSFSGSYPKSVMAI